MSFVWITEKQRRENERADAEANRVIAKAMPAIIKAIQSKGDKP